ncbi:hypothetical protein TYRP_023241 [Tyrophagus putrescentiae]|nr:hypothetical protein TYRP_023241 [Tyrophagus putrescentiae]
MQIDKRNADYQNKHVPEIYKQCRQSLNDSKKRFISFRSSSHSPNGNYAVDAKNSRSSRSSKNVWC